jgi:hypothetical protein
MSVYDGTTLVRLWGTFTNLGGTLTDAGSVSLIVAPPGAIGTPYTLTAGAVAREGTGVYYHDYTATQGGYYTYRWQGSGTVLAADGGRFFVRYDEVR